MIVQMTEFRWQDDDAPIVEELHHESTYRLSWRGQTVVTIMPVESRIRFESEITFADLKAQSSAARYLLILAALNRPIGFVSKGKVIGRVVLPS